MEFWVRYLALFHLFSVIDDFEWFFIGGFPKNMQHLVIELLKVPVLASHFLYYTLMTPLMALCVISLSVPMILLSSINLVRHLIRDNN